MGGSAGTVSLPTYLANMHTWMQDADRSTTNTATGHNYSATAGVGSMTVYDDMWAARGGPYDSDAYDPTEALDDMLTEVQEFETAISALSAPTDFQTYLDKVKANIGDLVIEEDLPAITDLVTVQAKDAVGAITVAAPGTVATVTVSRIDLPTINVAEMVTAFENRQQLSHARSVARFGAGMSDINAILSSSFVIGIGLLESEKQYQIEDFDAKVSLTAAEKEFDGELQGELAYLRAVLEKDMQTRQLQQQYDVADQRAELEADLAELQSQTQKDLQDQQLELDADKVEFLTGAELRKELPRLRVQAYLQGINMMVAMLAMKTQAQDSEAGKQLQYGQMKIVSETDETNRNLEIDHLDYTWNLSLYEYMERWMAAPSGAAVPQAGKPSAASSALGGAMAGAKIGSAIPGIGTGIGAAIGGIAGAFS